MKQVRILLVEDDQDFAQVVIRFLQENNITVIHAGSGQSALSLLQRDPCDLYILDIGLPDCNGFDLCEQFRRKTACPILILTALEREDDIVKGLQCGADDYVVKPCSLRVLHTRILTLLRRSDWTKHPLSQRMFSGQLEIDLASCTILRNGERLAVSDAEFQLCKMLLQGDGRILTRDFLLDQLGDTADSIENNTLTVYISRLRRKLGLYEGIPYIDTAPGIGYRWNIDIRRLLQ